MIVKLAFKEIRNHPRFAFFFVISVVLGLLGLTGIESFKGVVQTNLQSRSKELLGADLELSSRFPLEQKHIDIVKDFYPDFEVKRSTGVFSMTSFNGASRLIEIRAQDHGYPFYGQMVLGSGASYPANAKELAADEIWIYPELSTQMGVMIGDELPIGQANYKVVDIVTEDIQQSMQMGAIAPRVYMSPQGMERGGLIQFGSTATYKIGFKLPTTISVDSSPEKLAALKKSFDSTVRISTPGSEEDQVGRTLAYLGDFLGLVSLVALFLASVGIVYLYQAHLRQKAPDHEVLHAIGMERARLRNFAFIHLAILSLFGTLIALVVGQLAAAPLEKLAAGFLPIALKSANPWRPFILVLFVGVASPMLLSIPMVLRSVAFAVRRPLSFGAKLSWVAWPIFFSVLSFYVSQSFRVAGAFLGGIVLFLGLLLPLMGFLLKGIERWRPQNVDIRHALLKSARTWGSTLSIFLAVFYCSLVFNLIPQLRVNLENEIKVDAPEKRPSLFLFDVQDDQLAQLEDFAKEEKLPLMNVTPMVRARLVAVNGEKFEIDTEQQLTREDEREARFRNRGMNLSYASGLNSSERLVDGVEFTGPYSDETMQAPAEISLEERFASRLGLALGDVLEFDILGMPVFGKVVNLRSVRWTTFIPNFFITFQEGILNDAPKTFLATVGHLSEQAKDSAQVSLFKSFPNVSAIDVGRVIDRVVEVMGTMSFALLVMASLSIAVGLMVIGFVIHHQMIARERDIALEKMLGVAPASLMRKMRFEFLGILALASTGGIIASISMSYGLSLFLFDGLWTFAPELPIFSFCGIMLVGMLVVEILGRKAVATPAAVLFRDAA